MKVLVSSLAIVAALLLIGMGYSLVVPQIATIDDYDRLPLLTFKDLETGADVKISDFYGVPIVVNMWVSWNSYCKDELASFTELQREYGDKVRIIAINNGERDQVVQAFINAHSEVGVLDVWLDNENLLFKELDSKEVPETLFIDKFGQVTKHHRSHITGEQIKHSIEALIFEK